MARYNKRCMQTLAPPLKRLTRPDTPPPFRVTDRDIAILAGVARFRFLSSDQIARLDGGSARVLRRLQALYYHSYLDRPASQFAHLAAFFEGTQPLVYGLSKKGAKLLAEIGTPINAELDWISKNRRATAPFLAHTLAVADAILRVEFDCRSRGALQLIDHQDLVPLFPEATRELDDPFRLRVTHRSPDYRHIAFNVIPDRLFSLGHADNTRHNFALELDRGTMDIKAKKLTEKSSFRRKLIGYFEAWKQERHREQWGFQAFRILTITPSAKRIENMIAAQREVTGDSTHGLFLYATPDRIAEHGPLGPAWMNAKGDVISLVNREQQ